MNDYSTTASFNPFLSGKESDVRSMEAGSGKPSIKLNRLTIGKSWIGKGILLDIRDQKSGNLFRLPHDELIDIISKCSPAALKSKSWTHGELYSWPSISKLVLNELKERGFSGQK